MPWGRPVLSVGEGEVCSPILTHCGLQVRKSMIQLHNVLLIPSVLSLWMTSTGFAVVICSC